MNRAAFTNAARSRSYLSTAPTAEQIADHAEYAERLAKMGYEFNYCTANQHYAWKDGGNTFCHEDLVRGYLNQRT